jgi:hypothetical protein
MPFKIWFIRPARVYKQLLILDYTVRWSRTRNLLGSKACFGPAFKTKLSKAKVLLRLLICMHVWAVICKNVDDGMEKVASEDDN